MLGEISMADNMIVKAMNATKTDNRERGTSAEISNTTHLKVGVCTRLPWYPTKLNMDLEICSLCY